MATGTESADECVGRSLLKPTLFATAAGVGHWAVLRDRLPNVQLWAPATALGGTAGWYAGGVGVAILQLVAGSIVPLLRVPFTSSIDVMAMWTTGIGIPLGAILGLCQASWWVQERALPQVGSHERGGRTGICARNICGSTHCRGSVRAHNLECDATCIGLWVRQALCNLRDADCDALELTLGMA